MPEIYIMDNSKLCLAQYDSVLSDGPGIPILDSEEALSIYAIYWPL